jgi:tRNA (guanine-N7-)-methyltransferase
MTDSSLHQRIKSFVLRQGHLTPSQKKAIDDHQATFGILYEPKPFNPLATFGNNKPLILEIGFGMGVATAAIAENQPDTNFIAAEVHAPGVGNLYKLIAAKQLNNLRIIQHDVIDVIDHMIEDQMLDGIHIFFPDPWHKKRHHKRRLIQLPFIEKITPKLKQGAYLHIATDWAPYAEAIMTELAQQTQLINSQPDPMAFSPKPLYRPLTKFEQRGLNLGHTIADIVFIKP